MAEFDQKQYLKEFEVQVQAIRESLLRIGTRQSEIQAHIGVLADSNKNLEVMINGANISPGDRSKMYGVVAKNTELISSLYSTSAQFEATRFRYHQELNKLYSDKNKFIYIDIRLVDEKFNKIDKTFSDLMSAFSSQLKEMERLKKDDHPEKITTKFDDPAYQLD